MYIEMKQYIIAFFFVLSPLFAQVSINVYQNGSRVGFDITPEGDGAFVQIADPGDSTLWSGIVETTTTVELNICPPGSVSIRWSALIVPGLSGIVDMGEKLMIPGGWFEVGADSEDVALLSALGMPPEIYGRAQPRRWAFIDSFEIWKDETPCSLFSRFIAEGGYSESSYWSAEGWAAMSGAGWSGPSIPCPDGGLPVRGISYYEAEACANWFGANLAYELQWEAAARMGVRDIFPWGDHFCPGSDITANINDINQCEIDTFDYGPGYPEYFTGDIAPSGCLAMGGNISEWCRDGWDEYNLYVDIDPLEPFNSAGDDRTVRGGNYATWDRYECSPLFRTGYDPVVRDANLGFRIARLVGDGAPNDWVEDTYIFDCEAPELLEIIFADCLEATHDDSIGFVFSEAVIGDPATVPDDTNIFARNDSTVSDTLWLIILAGTLGYGDSLGVDLSTVTDTAGNPVETAETTYFFVCTYDLDVVLSPEDICIPVDCRIDIEAIVTNIGTSGPIAIDSIVIDAPFEASGFSPVTLAPGDSARFNIIFQPGIEGDYAGTLEVHHSDGFYAEEITAFACGTDSVYFQPQELDFGDVYEAVSGTSGLVFDICEECTLFALRVGQIWWTDGALFSTDLAPDTVLDYFNNTVGTIVHFDPDYHRGAFTDTLHVQLLPENAECERPYIAHLPVSATSGSDTDCTPTVECRGARLVRPCDTVKGTESIYFTGICEGVVEIYDHRGRFVVELAPDSYNEVEWNLTDESGNLVPSGLYYWASGKSKGNIAVVR